MYGTGHGSAALRSRPISEIPDKVRHGSIGVHSPAFKADGSADKHRRWQSRQDIGCRAQIGGIFVSTNVYDAVLNPGVARQIINALAGYIRAGVDAG